MESQLQLLKKRVRPKRSNSQTPAELTRLPGSPTGSSRAPSTTSESCLPDTPATSSLTRASSCGPSGYRPGSAASQVRHVRKAPIGPTMRNSAESNASTPLTPPETQVNAMNRCPCPRPASVGGTGVPKRSDMIGNTSSRHGRPASQEQAPTTVESGGMGAPKRSDMSGNTSSRHGRPASQEQTSTPVESGYKSSLPRVGVDSSRSASGATSYVVLRRPPLGDGPLPWELSPDGELSLSRPGSTAAPRRYRFLGGVLEFQNDQAQEIVDSLGESLLVPLLQRVIMNSQQCCFWLHGPRGSGKSKVAWGNADRSGDCGLAGSIAKSVFHVLQDMDMLSHGGLSSQVVPDRVLVTVQVLKVGVQTELMGDCLCSPDLESRLRIRDNPIAKGFVLEGLPEAEVCSNEEALAAICRAVQHLQMPGSYSTGKSRAIDERAHGLFTLRVRRRDTDGSVHTGTFHLLDLAGAELSGPKGATAAQKGRGRGGRGRGKGEQAEDRTLKAMLRVVGELADSPDYVFRDGHKAPRHIPYRDSKVTRLLSECLGGPGCSFLLSFSGQPDHDAALGALELASRHEQIRPGAPLPDVFNREAQLARIAAELEPLAEVLGFADRLPDLVPADLQLDMNASDELVRFHELLEERRRIAMCDIWETVRAESRAASSSRAGVGSGMAKS